MENVTPLTETCNPESAHLDEMTPLELVELMHREDFKAVSAVEASLPVVAAFIEAAAGALKSGGRLFYRGAGTSGRLGILDAAECPPTFGTDPDLVQGLIAGGAKAVTEAVEGAEDDREAAFKELQARGLTDSDVIVGITASGSTPFVAGALERLKSLPNITAAVFCNPEAAIKDLVRFPIALPVGPEVLSGSTRLKAGTATKLVLNMISTGIMVALGKCIGNFMVDMRASNAKLIKRQIRMAAALADVSEEEAESVLEKCHGNLRAALEILKKE